MRAEKDMSLEEAEKRLKDFNVLKEVQEFLKLEDTKRMIDALYLNGIIFNTNGMKKVSENMYREDIGSKLICKTAILLVTLEKKDITELNEAIAMIKGMPNLVFCEGFNDIIKEYRKKYGLL